MDTTAQALQEKLRKRRQAMNITMQTSSSTAAQDVTTIDIESDEEVENIPTIDEEVDEDEEASTSRLKEQLESRHDATRRRLQKAEIHETPPRPSSGARLEDSSRPVTPAMSLGHSQEFASPRSELDSTLNSTFGGRSSGMSLRNRLQAKLQAAKQQRGMSPMGEERKRTQKLKERIVSSTRFDVDPLRTFSRPDLQKERELESKISAKLKWKKVLKHARDQVGQPGDAECYDFFTKQFEEVTSAEAEPPPTAEEPATEEDVSGEQPEPTPVQQEPEISEEPQPTEGDAVVGEDETGDEKKKLISEIIPDELDWKLFNITAAEYISYRSRLETENKLSFVPSLLDAPPERKVLDNAAPLYLEEEGFYVGLMPEVQIRNRNILENRILHQEHQDDKSWFGLDGRVNILPNPVRTLSTKPWVSGLEEIDPSIETIYVKAYESSVDDKYLHGTEDHELQVDVGSLVFHHHPLMSREHVLASSMSELYDAYIRHRHKNYAVFYYEKLRALRAALRTMKRNASTTDDQADIAIVDDMELRIQDYLIEIRRTCRQRDLAKAYERDLMRKIVAEWKEIKNLRISQRFNNTSIKLTVKRQEVNQETDRQQWMEEIDKQLGECSEEHNYTVIFPHRKEMLEYEKNFQEWKKTRIKLKKQQKALAEMEGADAQITEEEDLIVGANPKPLKPKPPPKFDEVQVREQLINQALQHRRNPGEPKISLEVTNTGTISPTVPEGEAARRRSLQNSSMFAKIKFNGRDVCTSDTKSLTSDFRVHFGQIFKILISQWPDSVRIQLFEAGRLSNTLLDEISLGIPDGSVNSANAQMFPVDFSNDKIITHPNHEGVGSSTAFTLRSDSTVPVSLKTRGQLFVSIAWGLNQEGKVLAPKLLSHQGIDPLEAPGRQMLAHQDMNLYDQDMTELWSQEGKLDPNDPANSGLVPFTHAKEGVAPAIDYFRLDQLQQQFNFVTDEELNQAKRLRLLEYRTKGISEFRNLNMVPANEHEILDAAFTAYERHKREKDELGEMGEKKVGAGTLSAHRLEVLRFRQRVRDSVLRRFYSARHYHTLQDMVHEEQVPDIGTLGVNLLKFAEPRRPLKPVRTERKKATAQNLTEGSVSLQVSVVRAFNLPIRDKTPLPVMGDSLQRAIMKTTSENIQDDAKETYKLAPFVSVSFQGNVKTTSIAQGPNPSWNEEVELPFSAVNNDYTPESLQTIDDTLFIHVFDRVKKDLNVDPRSRQEVGESSGATTGIISHRVQNHWIGSLKIPFSTIYQQGRIDGTFKLNVPQVMLGYTTNNKVETKDDGTQAVQTGPSDPYAQMQSQFLQPHDGSYISVFISLEPLLGRPEQVPQKFETQEDERLIAESLKYMEDCQKKFPKRRVKTTVIDIKGESVFITRFVKPLPPPPVLVEGSSPNSLITAEKLARFVSMIPFVSDNVIFAGRCDLWSTCDQFLNMLCGDEEEHAILLLNYFLHIGKKAYLLLGSAIPEGETAYVLTLEESQEYLLWNASTGQHYKTTNYLCPLQSIHAIINQNNVWFNMQVYDIPARVNFNVNNAREWKPLFKSTTSAQALPSVQPDSLIYAEPELPYVRNLQEKIERVLRDSIMKWRPHYITRWNRSCSSALHQILQGLEIERWHGTPGGGADLSAPSRTSLLQDDHAERLKRLIGDARFVGFPMDMPFTDIDAVVKAVRSTEIHKIQDNDIEFAISVYVHPYPASVLCVWVYVAAVNNTRPF